ncbi:phage tail protein [Vibrio sp. 10N.261.46.A3]|uniref:phage tail protein n=1 Tax=Vibrio sp. 10N.261.46.A3 TaxID=3229658 RepID=UPI0035504A2E
MSVLTMRINGNYHAFYKADLSFSVEQLAHTFRCDIPFMSIDEPLPVEFFLNDRLIFVGQVDSVDSKTSSGSQVLSVGGRSKSANMVDSRITMDALYDQDVETLLRKLAKPFGLGVKSQVKNMPYIDEFQVNAESPVDNVAQLIREQGYMLIERNGVLTIEEPAHATVDGIGLEVGENVDSLAIKKTFNGLFHTTEVQGQWDDSNALAVMPSIHRSRTRVIICDQLQHADACFSRAQYEKNLSIAQSLVASSSIAELFPELAIDGLNRVIQVADPTQGFSEMLMIKSLGLSVSESSTSTSIELSRPFKEQCDV